MKKLFILILAGMMAAPSFAQFSTSRSRSRYNHNDTENYYGLRLGVNFASLSSDMAGMDMDSRAGIAFGGVYGLQLANSMPVWLELGAFYSEKGGTTKNFLNNSYYEGKPHEVKCRLSYLQVPVVVKYSLDLIDDLYLQPFLGGYMALGLAGKTKHYMYPRDSHSSYDLVDRFDGGLRIGCGLEYDMLYAEAGFDFGIANIGDDDFDGIHTRSFFVNVGVNF